MNIEQNLSLTIIPSATLSLTQEETESSEEEQDEDDEAQGSGAGDRSESLLTAADQKTVVDILAR